MKIIARDIPPRRLGAGAGRCAPAAGAPVRGPRRHHGHDELDDGLARLLPPSVAPDKACSAAAVAGRRHRQRPAPVHRGRLRLRRRHRLRRGRARPAPAGRAACGLPGARPRGGRLRPDPTHRPAREGRAAPTCSSPWTTASPAWKAWPRQRAGPAGAGHRPPPARAELPPADAIVNPNQPGCTFPEQGHGRGGRDVLRAAGAARRTAPARRVRRRDSQPRLDALLPWSPWAPWPTW